ncbi:MAG TPA: hypothetical protein PK156_45095, partial [Polyangium sp.]|nr:hypothetical protein [Polyangium sp.]
IDSANLGQTGWGLVFPAVDKGTKAARHQQAISDALGPLRALRRSQAGHLYKEYRGDHAFRRGETKQQFLAKHRGGSGAVNPEAVPYYLLLVGSPEEISFDIQIEIDVQYAVGRIHFDTVEEYAHYARSVVMAESGAFVLPREVAFVGVHNSGDMATQLSRFNLVGPLASWAEVNLPNWKVSRYFDENACKATVTELLGGSRTPALLFSASHGMPFGKGHPQQRQHQGALLLQDWRGPTSGPPDQSMYFSGDDVSIDKPPAGLISFHFACYGAGTPLHDEFTLPGETRVPIAEEPFVAALPKKLLGHSRGGALATIGHIDRTWDDSFIALMGIKPEFAPLLNVFESTLRSLMNGKRVGAALEYFNQRHAELGNQLCPILANEFRFNRPTPHVLIEMWRAYRDARGYAIIGDPAVRISVEGSS